MEIKKLILFVLALFSVALIVSCTKVADNEENMGKDKGKDAEVTEKSDDVNKEFLGEIQLFGGGKEVDIVDSDVRAFVDKALAQTEIDYNNFEFKDVKANPSTTWMLVWRYKNMEASSAKVYITSNEDLSNPKIYDAEKNTCNVTNLMTATRYYWWVEAETEYGTVKSDVSSFDVKDGPRVLKVSGISNFRDLGSWTTADGKHMKQGMAYRCASPDAVKEAGLDLILNELGVRTQLDLRTPSEGMVAEYNSRGIGSFGENVEYINMTPAPAYTSIFKSQLFADELRLFANPEKYPIIFHCAGGADRTGTLALFLEGICGCDEVTCVTDYELTIGRYRGYTGESDGTSPIFDLMVQKIKGYSGETFSDKILSVVRETLGLNEMEISNIYNLLMNDSGVFTKNSLSAPKSVAGGFAFDIDLRKSGGIKSVTIHGKEVKWSYEDGTLAVISDYDMGTITFNDGGILNFGDFKNE